MRRSLKQLALIPLCAFGLLAQTSPASIDGFVTDSVTGAPVPRAHVSVEQRLSSYGAVTDAEGKFAISGMVPGSYFVRADRPGFVKAESPITLGSGDARTGFEIKLVPTGSITGRVTNAEGEPAGPVAVETEGIGVADGGGWQADDKGQFRIGGLAPGVYRVKAVPDSAWRGAPEIRTDGTVEQHDTGTYYPNVTGKKEAARVRVRAGEELRGIDIQVVRTPFVRISGKVLGFPRGATNSSIVVANIGNEIKPDGSFELWRVDPGKYTLSAEWNTAEGEMVHTAGVDIEVAESNIDHIELRVVPDSDIAGRFEFEDDQAKQSLPKDGNHGIVLLERIGEESGQENSIPGGSDDTFRLTEVPAAKYRVGIELGEVYVKSMRLGSTIIDGSVLDLRNGSGGADLSLRLSASTGSVSGTVRGEGPSVVVLTAGEEDPGFAARHVAVKADGSYSFSKVPPGKYALVAVPESDYEPKNGSALGYEDVMERVELGDGDKVIQDLKRQPAETQ